MALGARTTNTAAEAMRSLLQDLAYIKSFPDADLDFLTTIEQGILNKLKEPVAQYMQRFGPGAQQGAAQTGGLGTAGNPMVTQLAQQIPSGLRNGGSLPPVDELRRMMSGVTGA